MHLLKFDQSQVGKVFDSASLNLTQGVQIICLQHGEGNITIKSIDEYYLQNK